MIENQKRILHVVPSFYPATAFGGPIFSTKAICDGVAAHHKTQVRVLTTDAAGPSTSERLDIESNPLTFPAGYTVQYCKRIGMASISPGLLLKLPGAIMSADIVHLTGTYSFPTIPTLLLCNLIGRPVVWSPRGALQATKQWPETPRRWVKHLFEHICQIVRPARTTLHVTAGVEADMSRDRLEDIPVAIIPNSIDVPRIQQTRRWRPDGNTRLMFISRLHQKKGVEILIDTMARLPENYTLDVYGEGAPAYVETLHDRVAEKGLTSRVVFHGHVEGKDKTLAFLKADLFCLPTWSENFGIVVGEALAHGVPAITTTNAPWCKLEEKGCGLWIEPTVEALLSSVLSLESSDLGAMGQRGRDWMGQDFSSKGVVNSMLELYDSISKPTTQMSYSEVKE